MLLATNGEVATTPSLSQLKPAALICKGDLLSFAGILSICPANILCRKIFGVMLNANTSTRKSESILCKVDCFKLYVKVKLLPIPK